MSEMSQGPGWWMASDGKWYPPQLHPSLGPPPPPPPSAAFGASSPASTLPPLGKAGLPPLGKSGLPPLGKSSAPWGPPRPGSYADAADWSARQSFGDVDTVLGIRLAPWWKRLVAIIIDNIILGLGVFILALIIGIIANASRTQGTGSSGTTTQTHGAAVLVGLIILWLLVSIPIGLYYAIMNGSRRGQTVGKLALSIAVRDARTGAPIGFWRAAGRFAITIVFTLLLYIPYLLDSLAPLWDKRRQSWHDKVARTVVVDLKP